MKDEVKINEENCLIVVLKPIKLYLMKMDVFYFIC